MQILGFLFLGAGSIVGLICGLTILIDAFKNEVWKGLAYLFCGLYALYYMFAEFENENKTMIILGALLGPLVGFGIFAACNSIAH